MTNNEAIEILKVAKSEIEWEYPMDYQIALDKAIKALKQEPALDEKIKNVLEPTKDGYFTIIKEWNGGADVCKIVYANDTKVKYLLWKNGYRTGITPLYNADGSLQIYKGE